MDRKIMGNKLVDFVIAGAQKSGTTALKRYLEEHEAISFSAEEEAHFFCTAHPPFIYDDYHKLYAHASENQVWGDKTPSYMYYEHVPERIWTYNAEMKILIILRNPVDRAYSQYQMMLRNGWTGLGFNEVLQDEGLVLLKSAPRQIGNAVFSRGCYVEQIRRLQRFFPREQLLFIKSEDLSLQPQLVVDKVYSFLRIEKKSVEPVGRTTTRSYQSMPESARAYLSKRYYHEVKQLEILLDWNLSDWLNKMRPYL